MRTHDDRPGDGGGYPDDRNVGGTSQGPAGFGGYDYYDDEAGYSDAETTALARSRSDDYYDELTRENKQFSWNAGADLGLLVLRLALGGVFIVHGAQKLFGAFGGPGTDGFARMLSEMGFQQSAVLALVTGGTELGAGALLVLGLFTPLAAAGLLGVMASAVVMNFGSGFFASAGGFEFEAVLAAMALGLMFTGPGRVALDNGRSWFRHPLASGFIALLIAVGSAATVLFLLR